MAKKDQPKPDETKDALDPGVLAGKAPEQEEPEGEGKPAPSLITVKYGGKEYPLPQEFVEGAWNPRESEFSRKISEQGEELGRLRKLSKGEPPRDGTVLQGPDWDRLIFENPSKAIELLEQRIYGNISTAYDSQRAVDRFWSSFYDQNPDLKGEDFFIQSIANRPEVKGLRAWDENGVPNPESIERLANLARKEILRLSKKAGGNAGEALPSRERTIVEGAGPPVKGREAPKEEEGPKSIGEVLGARKRARAEAGARGGK